MLLFSGYNFSLGDKKFWKWIVVTIAWFRVWVR